MRLLPSFFILITLSSYLSQIKSKCYPVGNPECTGQGEKTCKDPCKWMPLGQTKHGAKTRIIGDQFIKDLRFDMAVGDFVGDKIMWDVLRKSNIAAAADYSFLNLNYDKATIKPLENGEYQYIRPLIQIKGSNRKIIKYNPERDGEKIIIKNEEEIKALLQDKNVQQVAIMVLIDFINFNVDRSIMFPSTTESGISKKWFSDTNIRNVLWFEDGEGGVDLVPIDNGFGYLFIEAMPDWITNKEVLNGWKQEILVAIGNLEAFAHRYVNANEWIFGNGDKERYKRILVETWRNYKEQIAKLAKKRMNDTVNYILQIAKENDYILQIREVQKAVNANIDIFLGPQGKDTNSNLDELCHKKTKKPDNKKKLKKNTKKADNKMMLTAKIFSLFKQAQKT